MDTASVDLSLRSGGSLCGSRGIDKVASLATTFGSTELFERYQRSDKILVLALQESYLQGVYLTKPGQAIPTFASFGKIWTRLALQ